MTRVTRLIHNVGKYLLISIYPLPTHPTHNFTHKNGGNLDTLPGWPKKLHLNRPAQCAGQKQDKVKVTNFKKLPKIQILQETLHATHLLKLLDKMYKYEMDPTRTVGTTERTRDAGRKDGQTDGRTDGWSETNIIPNNFVVWGYKKRELQNIIMSNMWRNMNTISKIRRPSLTPWYLGDLGVILKMQIFNLILLIGVFRSSYDNVVRWMPQDLYWW